ncbi:Dopamine D2-like receptor [Bienertia sinuspersici]
MIYFSLSFAWLSLSKGSLTFLIPSCRPFIFRPSTLLEIPKGVLENSRNMKDEVTFLKKEGDFDNALENYNFSCEDARSSFSQLASTVVLNLAASLLKEKEVNETIGLGKYELASWDLRVALKVESSNQEVVRKLKKVEQIMHSILKNSHGQGKKKQKECGPIYPINGSIGNERDSNQYERDNFICNDFDDCNMMEVEKSDERDSVIKNG